MSLEIRTPSLVTVQPLLRDPREQPVLSPTPAPAPPAHLFGEPPALLQQRRERAQLLADFWEAGDVRGFSLFAGEFIWQDPAIATLLPDEARPTALKLVSQAAIRLYRQGQR